MKPSPSPSSASQVLSRRSWLLALGSLGITPMLGACTGGADGSSRIRVINATQGLSALDAYLDTTSIASSVASAAASRARRATTP